MNLRFEQPFEDMASPTTARDPLGERWNLKSSFAGPVFFVDEIALPPEVPVGGTVDVEVEAVNTALNIPGDDPDSCKTGSYNGYRYETAVSPSWADGKSSTQCLGMQEDRGSMSFSFEAPQEPGSHEVSVEVSLPGSGASGSQTYQIAVVDDSEGGDDRPDPGDDPEDTPIRPDPEPTDPTSPIIGGGQLTTGLVILVLVLLLLLAVGVAV